MNAAFDVNSKTLLELRVFEDRRAWSEFLSLYMPMMRAWGRLRPDDDDIEELTGRLLASWWRRSPGLTTTRRRALSRLAEDHHAP